MPTYQELSQKPRQFLALTGYTVEEFDALVPYFEAAFKKYVSEYRLDGKKRTRRRYSEYKNSPLPTINDKLLFILVYVKQGHLQEVQASLFGMEQPNANTWIHLLHPLLNQALVEAGEMPAREAAELEAAETEGELGAQDFFQDGTERPIPRPSDPADQRTYYSGKKKQHTLKNIVVSDARGKIILLSETCEGKKHDKKAIDEVGYRLPEGSRLYQDTGFQGFNMPDVEIIQPQKKPRGKELSSSEKARNADISKVRIRVEHAIGGVKRYRIVKDKIRAWAGNFRDKVMETCCALHNFRLNFRPWSYDPA